MLHPYEQRMQARNKGVTDGSWTAPDAAPARVDQDHDRRDGDHLTVAGELEWGTVGQFNQTVQTVLAEPALTP
jgi:hypothetical protein